MVGICVQIYIKKFILDFLLLIFSFPPLSNKMQRHRSTATTMSDDIMAECEMEIDASISDKLQEIQKERNADDDDIGIDDDNDELDKELGSIDQKDIDVMVENAEKVAMAYSKKNTAKTHESSSGNAATDEANRYNLLNEEQKLIVDLARRGSTVYYRGSAGTGKSFTVPAIKHAMLSRYAEYASATRGAFGQQPIIVGVAAPTGIAADRIGGVTIHSLLGITPADTDVEQTTKALVGHIHELWDIIESPQSSSNEVEEAKRRLTYTDMPAILTLRGMIFDEVSMVSGGFMEFINNVLQASRRNKDPMGGIQMVCSGDFLQLPCITKKDDPPIILFFKSEVCKQLNFQVVTLTKILRQKDVEFQKILFYVRTAAHTPKSVEIADIEEAERVKKILNDFIDSHRQPTNSSDNNADDGAVDIVTVNKDVDAINTTRLAMLPGAEKVYNVIDDVPPGFRVQSTTFNVSSYPLRLKMYARVMLLSNRPNDKLVNGSLGVVVKLGHDTITVKFDSGQTVEFSRQAYKSPCNSATRFQFPFNLAWALTTHKCQGLTFNKVRLHLSRIFSTGQMYTAWSRVTSPDGIQFIDVNIDSNMVCPEALKHETRLDRRVQQALEKLSIK